MKPNGKEPMCKWRDPSSQQKQDFNPLRFNTGVPTGYRNNLLVVDLDVKDDGVEEFKKYLSEHGRPETLTVKTTTGGYHFYFNYSHEDLDSERMIKDYLRNTTKFRGKGIDVRSEGGYVVAPPSMRDGREYETINARKPTDVPSSLISWLLEGRGSLQLSTKRACKIEPHTHQQTAPHVEYEFDLSEAVAAEILAELEPKRQFLRLGPGDRGPKETRFARPVGEVVASVG